MRLRWQTDPEATAVLWQEMWSMADDVARRSGGWIAHLGGAAGSIPVGSRLHSGARFVTVDVDRIVLRHAAGYRRPVQADIRRLPIRDGALDAAVGRAILHHVPDDLDASLREAWRALKPGGLILFQEPTAGNLLANLARRWLPTELHDPHERPLPWNAYVEAIGRHFEFLETRPYYLGSYLLPHLVGRLPPARRRLARIFTRLVFACDRKILATLPGLRRRAAYIAVAGRRRGTADPRPLAMGHPST